MKRGTKKIRKIQTENNTYFIYDLDKDKITGKRKRLYAHTLEELEDKIQKEKEQKKLAIDKQKPKSKKLSDCINFYFEQMLEGQRTKTEIGRRIMLVKNTVYGSEIDIAIEDITFDLMQDFFDKVSKIYLKKSVDELFETIKMTFDLYEQELDFNKIEISEKTLTGYILTPEEYDSFIEYCLFDNCTSCGKNQIIILFCMFTGISYANAKKMTIDDLDLENNSFIVTGRTYKMDERTSSWLKEQKMLNRLGDKDLLFVNINGTSPAFASIRVTINYICVRLGLPKSLAGKTVPKSFVIWKLNNGFSIQEIADYLGVKTSVIDAVYDEYKARQYLFK